MNVAPPREFTTYLEPLGMLAEHRIDDANEGLIAVEETVASCQQIAFQPTFTLVLAEHRNRGRGLAGKETRRC
jgi:predicted acetyltransferase